MRLQLLLGAARRYMVDHVCGDHHAEVHVIIAGLDDVLEKRVPHLYQQVTGAQLDAALKEAVDKFNSDIEHVRSVTVVAGAPLVRNTAHNAS